MKKTKCFLKYSGCGEVASHQIVDKGTGSTTPGCDNCAGKVMRNDCLKYNGDGMYRKEKIK